MSERQYYEFAVHEPISQRSQGFVKDLSRTVQRCIPFTLSYNYLLEVVDMWSYKP